MQTDDFAVLGNLHVGLDELHASQLHTAAERRHRVGRQFVAVLRVAAMGHDPHLRGIEIAARPAQRKSRRLDLAHQRFGAAVGIGDLRPNRVTALLGIAVRERLRSRSGLPAFAAVAEIPAHARDAGHPVERKDDLLPTRRKIVAHDHGGFGITHRDRSRQFAHRTRDRCDGGFHRVVSGSGIGMVDLSAGCRRRGLAVAEHPQHTADVRHVAAEREAHGLPGRGRFGRPDDRKGGLLRPGPLLPAAVRTGGDQGEPRDPQHMRHVFQAYHRLRIIPPRIRDSGKVPRG